MIHLMSGKRAASVLASIVAICGLAGSATAADVQITNVPTNNGYMNVFELPGNGGGYVFGGPWGAADLRANWTGSVLKLEAAPIGTGDAFWYQNGTGGPGADGNKQMEANYYVENDALNGDTVSFSMNVLENTLVNGYASTAFIKEFDASYSLVGSSSVVLTPGTFSISLVTSGTAGHHIQYGFSTTGANVWTTDVESKGYVTITAVPEPMSLGVIAGGAMLVVRRRRRNG